ncbi:helix-turn-helix domain-containing protein [Rhodobium gokarnense]|uniref:Transcriptional regulator with XRE-family HTH domain n=1 Tax=Rhodobium gokarnense TaxID=364296 RepID=A0ABT3HI78_9HYPH|nr:XRE family transcriptional regulator [Rhodobium gokarnense]MCW2310104.1 transcriptional regulator with XRE-family HTH domain [Rhodobium gokarnense]
MSTPEIGPVLQRRRKAEGLTLGQLAERSSVSKSMLSQIERGQANPTFAVLWSLTRALGIELADLVDGAVPAGTGGTIEIVSPHAIPEMRSPDGQCRLRIFSPPQMAGMTEWYELTVEPGGILDSSAHTHGATEHLTVYEGALTVTSGGASERAHAGDTARYPADTAHSIANRGDAAARALLVVAYR